MTAASDAFTHALTAAFAGRLFILRAVRLGGLHCIALAVALVSSYGHRFLGRGGLMRHRPRNGRTYRRYYDEYTY